MPVTLGRDADELCERVVHVKHLIMENFLEDGPRAQIGLQYVAIDGEPAGGGLLRQMEECQHRVVCLFVDLQVVEAMPARRNPVGLKRGP